MILIDLFIAFFKTGLLSFGGGYAMISTLCAETVENNWMSKKEFYDIVTISQVTPGPIAVNMATFVGYKKYKLLGAIIATLGVCLPSFLMAITSLYVINKLSRSDKDFLVKDIFHGLKPAVVGLVCVALVQISRVSYLPDIKLNMNDKNFFFELWNLVKRISWLKIIISVLGFIALYKFKINTGVTILIFVLVGIIIL